MFLCEFFSLLCCSVSFNFMQFSAAMLYCSFTSLSFAIKHLFFFINNLSLTSSIFSRTLISYSEEKLYVVGCFYNPRSSRSPDLTCKNFGFVAQKYNRNKFGEQNVIWWAKHSTASECSIPSLKPIQKTRAKHIAPFLSCILKYFSNF